MTTVRPEAPADVDAIRDVVRLAFTGHPYSSGTEPLIVDALRAEGALELSLVAEVDGAVVGHIAFSPGGIGGAMGWSVVGPVAVRPGHQGRGIGRALVETGVDLMRSRGARGCVLVGDPDFYRRFGFEQRTEVTWPGVPGQNVLLLPFADEEPAGEITYHPAFLVGT